MLNKEKEEEEDEKEKVAGGERRGRGRIFLDPVLGSHSVSHSFCNKTTPKEQLVLSMPKAPPCYLKSDQTDL